MSYTVIPSESLKKNYLLRNVATGMNTVAIRPVFLFSMLLIHCLHPYASTIGETERVVSDNNSWTFDIKFYLSFYKRSRSAVLIYRSKYHTGSI